LVDLADVHEQTYSTISQQERLQSLNLNSAAFNRLKKNLGTRLDRESCIPEEDILQAVNQIISYPYLGGNKGSLKLQHDERGYIGSTTYQEIKHQLKTAVAKELLKRKEKSELQIDQHHRYQQREEAFSKIEPEKKHEVWSIDFLKIILFGIYFRICVVYDIFSQGYLSIKPAIDATSVVAEQALTEACQLSGQVPEKCLLSDNGSQLTCDSFEETKKKLGIQSQFIPPGQPWHNGGLESGNRDLRTVIYTTAFYDACDNTTLSKVGADADKIFRHLQVCCQKALHVINEEIVRPKFNTTPVAVWNDEVESKKQCRIRYIDQKRQQRKERMERLKITGSSNRKRIEDKVADAWEKVASKLSTEQLFAFREMINKRYRAIMI